MSLAKRSVVLNDCADTCAKFIQGAQRDMFPLRYEPQAGFTAKFTGLLLRVYLRWKSPVSSSWYCARASASGGAPKCRVGAARLAMAPEPCQITSLADVTEPIPAEVSV